MRKHCMIDLETFSARPDAAVVQLGAATISLDDPGAAMASMGLNITLQSEVLLGAHIDFEKRGTVDWWRDQTEVARESICGPAQHIRVALHALTAFYVENECEAVWSHGANFDVPILDWHYARLDMRAPWKYTAVRDTRTLFWLAGFAGWEKPQRDVDHIARLDAEHQAHDVEAALHRLKAVAPTTFEGLIK